MISFMFIRYNAICFGNIAEEKINIDIHAFVLDILDHCYLVENQAGSVSKPDTCWEFPIII